MMDLLALQAGDYLDRKQAEEEIRQSHEGFSELVERAPFGIYVVDSEFRITLMNSGSQTGAFRNVRPVIGRDLAEAMRIQWPEPVAEGIIGAFRHTLETGESFYSPPFTNPRRDEQALESYEWELHRIILPDGQYGAICYYFDSTKLRQAEAALRERTEELAAMVDWMPASVWIAHDPQCRKVTGNTAASKLLCVSPTDNVSQTPGGEAGMFIRHFDSNGRELQPNELPIQQAAATGVPVENRELQLLLPDGRRVWIAGSAAPFLTDRKVRGGSSARFLT